MSAKRKAVSMDTKLQVIRALESGQKMSKVVEKFDLVYSTISSIWYARAKIEAAATTNCNHASKKLRKATQDDLDQALLKWFSQQRSLNIPVSGPILKVKADQLAGILGINDFDCTGSWIECFKKRHDINFGKIYR